MTLAEFYRQKAKEEIDLAKYYERIPEDTQKAAGAREARANAAFYLKMAEEAEKKGQ
jgi:hypothetical protein